MAAAVLAEIITGAPYTPPNNLTTRNDQEERCNNNTVSHSLFIVRFSSIEHCNNKQISLSREDCLKTVPTNDIHRFPW